MKKLLVLCLALVTLMTSITAPAALAEEAIPKAKKKVTFKLEKKSMTVVQGFSGEGYIKVRNADIPEGDLSWTVNGKGKSVAACDIDGYDDDEGYVFFYVDGLKPGKATIKITSKSLKKSVKLSVKIVKNEYTAKKPSKGDGKNVFITPKKMYYSGSTLIADMFIYNKTGKTILGLDGLVMQLAFWDDDENFELIGAPVAYNGTGIWRPKGGKLKKNKYATVRFQFPNALDKDGDQYYLYKWPSLTVYPPYEDDDEYDKSFSKKIVLRPGMKGAVMDKSAMPDDAYILDELR